MGIGFDDALSTIALPLIIALFAFAFPFLFDAINHINSKYKSKEISEIFDNATQYKQFIFASRFSVICIIVFGALTLVIPRVGRDGYLIFFNFASAFIGLYYSIVILYFVSFCIRFNKPNDLLQIVKSIRDKELNRLTNQNIKATIGGLIQIFKSLDRTNLKRVREFGQKLGSNYYKVYVYEQYIKRLNALTRYAVDHDDYSFYVAIIKEVNALSIIEERKCMGCRERAKSTIWDDSYKYYTNPFYKNTIEYLSAHNCAQRYKTTLLREWFQSQDTSMYPNVKNIVGIINAIIRYQQSEDLTFIQKYIDSSAWHFAYILRLANLAYIKGGNIDQEKGAETKSVNVWGKLRSIHYAMMAYLFSIGNYQLIKPILRYSQRQDYTLYPHLASDALRVYADAVKMLRNDGGFGEWSYDEFVGSRIDKDMIARYTAALVLMAPLGTELPISISMQNFKFIKDEKDFLSQYAKELKHDDALARIFPEIEKAKFDNKYSTCLEQLRCYRNINDKHQCAPFKNPTLAAKTKKQLHTQTAYFDYTKGCNDAYKNQAEQILLNIRQLLQNIFNKFDFKNVDNPQNNTELPFNAYKFYLRHSTSPFDGYRINSSITEVFRDRVNCLILTAISKMRSRVEYVTIADFDKRLEDITNKRPEDYFAIGVDSHFTRFEAEQFDYKNFSNMKFYDIPYSSINLLEKLDVYKIFKGSLIIIKKGALPSIVDHGLKQNLNFENCCNEVEGIIACGVTIDLGYSLMYNSDNDVAIIRSKPIIC
jgi:hypothetical protein